MYSAAADQINFSTGGSQQLAITTTGTTLFGNAIVTGVVTAGSGAVGTPSYSFGSDPDTGMYSVGANSAGFSANGVLIGSYASGGAWTLGPAAGNSQAHNIIGRSLTLTHGAAATSAFILITNSDNTSATSHALLELTIGGTSAGDPYIRFDTAQIWSIGSDNSDSDKFKITASSSLGNGGGTADFFTIDGSGLVTIGASGGTQVHIINGSTSTSVNSTIAGKLITTGAVVASAATINALASTTSYVKFSGSTATQINGITAGADGQMMCLTSLSANLTIANQNGSASGSARIYTNTGSDVVLTAPCSATLIYDSTAGSWFLVSNLA